MTTPKKPAVSKSATKPKSAPALLTFASADLNTYGHGVIVVARENGAKSDTGTFLVDAHCLGVRRATKSTVPTATFLNKVLPALHAEHSTVPVPPALALGLLTGAVSFAKSCGFAPADTYEGVLALFGDLEPDTPAVKFGKTGKPHFHPMPGDDEEFCEEILGKLRRTVGPSGFTYDLDELDEDFLDGDDDAGGDGFGDGDE